MAMGSCRYFLSKRHFRANGNPVAGENWVDSGLRQNNNKKEGLLRPSLNALTFNLWF
jgi:hypothetical protein